MRRALPLLLPVAAATALAGLAVVVPALPAAPAAAADPAPVLVWGVSDYFDFHLATSTTSGGASEDASGRVTFVDGAGTYDRATGAGSIAYRGSVSGSFAFGGATQYTITVADPVMTIDAEGEGELSVVVSSRIPEGSTADPESTAPARVVAATFEAGRWVSGEGEVGTQTVTPRWAGVLPAGSAEATALGIPAGQPVDGRSFAPAFLGNLVPGVRALFYASGSGNDARKAPGAFVAQGIGTGTATEPEPDPADALQWQVSGAFDATSETHALGGGATEGDTGVVSFPRTAGTYDAETGEATVSYAGSVTATNFETLYPDPGLPFPNPVPNPALERYSVTIRDPQVVTDLDGTATVSAVVSSTAELVTGSPGSTTPARVELVRFDAGVDPWVDGIALGRLVRTPAVFSQALLPQLVAPARAQFATTTTAAADLRPAQLLAVAPPAPRLTPDVTVTTTTASASDGLVLDVDGTGFRGRTRAGDTGVRVGLAPVGELPDVTTEEGLARFVVIADVPTASVVDHAFAVDLVVPADRLDALDPDTDYAVHTWQAPSRSNPTQDTTEAVAIDFVALGLTEPLAPAVSVELLGADADSVTWQVSGTGFTAVTNPGDDGVYVGLAESGELPPVDDLEDQEGFAVAAWVRGAQVVDHAFSVRITADRARIDRSLDHSVYTWQAHTRSSTSQDTETPVDVPGVAATLGSTSPHVSRYGRAAVFAVTVPATAGTPTGTVTASGLGARRTVRVVDGVATFRFAASQAVGRYRPTFAYSGDRTYAAATAATFFTVRRAVPTLRVQRTGPRRLVVRVVGPGTVARPTGAVVVAGRRVVLRGGRAVIGVPAADTRFTVRYRGSGEFRPVSTTVTAR